MTRFSNRGMRRHVPRKDGAQTQMLFRNICPSVVPNYATLLLAILVALCSGTWPLCATPTPPLRHLVNQTVSVFATPNSYTPCFWRSLLHCKLGFSIEFSAQNIEWLYQPLPYTFHTDASGETGKDSNGFSKPAGYFRPLN